jgi:metal-dependent amidase/aminoacylase/carboxypeptidase family protein
MKKLYMTPELEKTEFESCDLITLSIQDFSYEGIEDYGGI